MLSKENPPKINISQILEKTKQEQVRSMIGNFFMENWTKGKVHTGTLKTRG